MPHHRSLALLFPGLLLAVGCSGGTLVPSGGAPTPEPEPASAPASAPSDAPAVAPAPAPVSTAVPDSASQPGVSAYVPYGGGTAVQIRRIGQYSQSGITAPERLVIGDDSSYARFWSTLAVGGERPPVDFTRDVVVAVAGGQRSTGGYSIAVDRVTRSGAGVSVDVVQTTPGAGCIMSQALTQPVDVVVVAAADAKTWSFSERSAEQGCR